MLPRSLLRSGHDSERGTRWRISDINGRAVEDDPTIRDLTARALRELGCQVLEAENGPQGLAALRRSIERPGVDLLVTDVGLPGGLDGPQLAEAARALVPALPVLLITGQADAVLARNPLAPNTEILGKPFGLEALARRVQDMMTHMKGPA